MSKGKIIALSIFIIIIAILSFVKYQKTQELATRQNKGNKGVAKPLGVQAFIAQYSDISETVSANGTVLSQDAVNIQSEVSGRVVMVNIPEGTVVNHGTLLVKINDADLQAQLLKLQSQIKIAQSTYDRMKELMEVNGVSQSDLEASENILNNLKADIQLVLVDIDKTEIRAPFTGKLGLRNISVGAYLTPAVVISTLHNISLLKVDLSIPEKYAAQIKTGDEVLCFTSLNELPYSAKVIALEPQIDESTRNIRVRAVFLNPDEKLIPGTYVKADLIMSKDAKTIMIPSYSIIPDDKSNKIVVCKNGKAKFVSVEIGIRTADQIEILSGIMEGDTILASGLLQAKPDMPLTIKKIISIK